MKRPPVTTLIRSSDSLQSRFTRLQSRHAFYNLSSPAVLFALSCRRWHSQHRTTTLSRQHTPHTPIRHASSSTAAITKPKRKHSPPATTVPTKPTTTRLPHTPESPNLNPPETTYAPPLQLPLRSASQSYPSYLWQCGRAYIAFYKAGITNVRSTARLAKSLRQKAAASPQKKAIWTRAEWQIVRRSRRDMVRLPAFGMLVLLLGEWMPIVALYITPLIPEPCRIPAQVERGLRKREERRREREQWLAREAARLIHADRRPGASVAGLRVDKQHGVTVEGLDKLDLFTLLGLSTRLDAHSWVWDKLRLTPPKWVVRWGVGRRMAYLNKDDELIARDGGWQGLGKEEVKKACVERGIDVLGKNNAEMRRALAEYWSRRAGKEKHL